MTARSAADRLALRDLVDRYAAAVDDRRPEVVAELFTPDGVLVAPDPPRSLVPTVAHSAPAAITAAVAALGGFTATFHAVHSAVFDVDSEAGAATGRVTCTAHHLQAHPDGNRDLIWQIVYRDTYRRTSTASVADPAAGSGPGGAGGGGDGGGGVWRFARRELHIVSISTTSPRTLAPPK